MEKWFWGNILLDFTFQSEEDCIALLMERESQQHHLPQADYTKRLLMGHLDMAIRSNAIDWIQKVQAHHSFRPISAYVSVNYLDRFLSHYEIQQGKTWLARLLSVACLSLAAKMEETQAPLFEDLQVCDAKYVFDAKTIQRMELLVLSTLKWRMQVVTPFSFICYFLHKFRDGNLPNSSSIDHSVDLILETVRGINFLEFRPSEIAAAVALSALNETQILDIDRALSSCIYANKERVLRCHKEIQEMALMRKRTHERSSPSISAAAKSPNAVLDAAASVSFGSDDKMTVESHAICHHFSSPAAKRRKLNSSTTS